MAGRAGSGPRGHCWPAAWPPHSPGPASPRSSSARRRRGGTLREAARHERGGEGRNSSLPTAPQTLPGIQAVPSPPVRSVKGPGQGGTEGFGQGRGTEGAVLYHQAEGWRAVGCNASVPPSWATWGVGGMPIPVGVTCPPKSPHPTGDRTPRGAAFFLGGVPREQPLRRVPGGGLGAATPPRPGPAHRGSPP